MDRMKPGLHYDFEINDRVWFDLGDGEYRYGHITGISSQSIIFMYIVTLDIPISVPGWTAPWTTVTIPGGMLLRRS